MSFPRRYKLIDTLALLLLAIALVGPVFRIKYLDNWPSIESTFISDARLLANHLPHPGWQPLWYCGTRFDYIYPPALRYGTALISLAAHSSTAKAYHIYIGVLYVFGLVSVYWLALIGSQSRITAWLSAIGVALVSPSLILIRVLHNDSPWLIPQRLHVLMSYGEGPHISALSVLPAALAASFVALREWRPAALALAGVLCALVVANNFYGATALAIFFPIAVWSVWVTMKNNAVWLRAAAIAALAYGLSAFWLTPSYLEITAINLKWVSSPGNTSSRLIMLFAIAAFCAISWRWGKRKPERIWPIFVAGSALILTIYVVGYYYAGLRIVGDAPRLAPELDMALVLLFAEIIIAIWNVRNLRILAAALAVLIFYPSVRYLRHAYTPFVRAEKWEDQYERRITKWVHDNLPGQRVLASGTNRFWFDAWYDNAEPDGGSDQGMLNQILPAASFQIRQNERGDVSLLWLQALGTSAVIVPDNTSLEFYHDYSTPQKFRGLLPVLFDDQHGTVIYRVPRVFESIGRIIDRAKQSTIGEVRFGTDIETLKQYVSLIEASQQKETSVAWSGFDSLQVKASAGEGQSLLLQETYDPSWRVQENGHSLQIRRDQVMGFMLIDLSPGTHTLDLHFETPLENRIGYALFVVSLLAICGLVLTQRLRVTRPCHKSQPV